MPISFSGISWLQVWSLPFKCVFKSYFHDCIGSLYRISPCIHHDLSGISCLTLGDLKVFTLKPVKVSTLDSAGVLSRYALFMQGVTGGNPTTLAALLGAHLSMDLRLSVEMVECRMT